MHDVNNYVGKKEEKGNWTIADMSCMLSVRSAYYYIAQEIWVHFYAIIHQ